MPQRTTGAMRRGHVAHGGTAFQVRQLHRRHFIGTMAGKQAPRYRVFYESAAQILIMSAFTRE